MGGRLFWTPCSNALLEAALLWMVKPILWLDKIHFAPQIPTKVMVSTMVSNWREMNFATIHSIEGVLSLLRFTEFCSLTGFMLAP